jgi:hypothetical protein
VYWYFQVLADRHRKQFPLGSAYINTYDPRPMLHLRTEKNRRYDSYSFVNAVSRESNPPTAEELRHAYHIAGGSFVGKLKEFFIILDDDKAKKPFKAGPSKSAKTDKTDKTVKAGQGKRRASGEGGEAKKKVPATQ